MSSVTQKANQVLSFFSFGEVLSNTKLLGKSCTSLLALHVLFQLQVLTSTSAMWCLCSSKPAPLFVWTYPVNSQGEVEISPRNHFWFSRPRAPQTCLEGSYQTPKITFRPRETSSDGCPQCSDILKQRCAEQSRVIAVVLHADPPLVCSGSLDPVLTGGFKDGNLFQKSVLAGLLWRVDVLWRVKCQLWSCVGLNICITYP